MNDNWPKVPAPGEETIPAPAPAPVRALPADAGCWVDGARGIYAPVAMVDIAVSLGFRWRYSYTDPHVLEWARQGQYGYPDGGPLRQGVDDYAAAWHAIGEEVEQWLNDHVAPEGYSFGWFEGDFMLGHHRWWNHDDPDAEGWGRDRDDNPVTVDIHGKVID